MQILLPLVIVAMIVAMFVLGVCYGVVWGIRMEHRRMVWRDHDHGRLMAENFRLERKLEAMTAANESNYESTKETPK